MKMIIIVEGNIHYVMESMACTALYLNKDQIVRKAVGGNGDQIWDIFPNFENSEEEKNKQIC